MRTHQLFIGGSWTNGDGQIEVCSPYDGHPVASVARAGSVQLRLALGAAAAARPALVALPLHTRAAILERAAAAVRSRVEELAAVMVEEAGKPLALARIELDRCAETFADAARIARCPAQELLDLGIFPSGESRTGLLRRVPLGVVLGITPFNFPFMLVAHKVAPAVAAGCPIIVKPASQTPSGALLLAEILTAAGLPAGGINVVPCRGGEVEPLLDDPRVRLLTFTGSAQVGWQLKRRLWDRRVGLELGGNAGVIVEPDGGDVTAMARRVAVGAFSFAGQSCISVQRILVHETIAGPFIAELTAAAEAFPTGDPAREDVMCGPIISAADADRVESWVGAAVRAGARRLTQWRRTGQVVAPTLLADVPHDATVWADEVFAPVACIETYRSFDEALAVINDSRYGLQAGVFTRDIDKIQRASDVLEVGGVIQGDVPTWRSDSMPYGGVRRSGIGREGARWAIEEMTEPRLLVLRRG